MKRLLSDAFMIGRNPGWRRRGTKNAAGKLFEGFFRSISFLLLLLVLASCSPQSTSPEPPVVSHRYAPTEAVLLNPERGFFTPYELPGPAGFSPVRITGNTLVHLNLRLDEWREADIPSEVLEGLDENFSDIRAAGVKAIFRVAYNQGPYPDSEPDAPKRWILRHIQQLTPLFQKHGDVIAWVEAGFIGAWGEWHTSTHGLDNLGDKGEVLQALLAALPANRFVQVRYPADILALYPDPADAAAARVAHHNDCFLSSDTDVGTYERHGENTIVRDQAYLAELTRFTPMSGESCAPFPPRSECASALHEMELLHVSALNEAYHKGILRSWEQGGCMAEVVNRLGYRLALAGADFNEQVRPGGLLNLSVRLENGGFAALVNERPLFLVLEGEKRYPLPLPAIDPRTWQPGVSSFTLQVRLPADLPQGDYALALWLPDAAPGLQDNPLYAVRFANEGTWEEDTGFNRLGRLRVDASVPGSFERGTSLKVVEASQTSAPRPTAGPVPAATFLPAALPLTSVTYLNLQTSGDPSALDFAAQWVDTGWNTIFTTRKESQVLP